MRMAAGAELMTSNGVAYLFPLVRLHYNWCPFCCVEFISDIDFVVLQPIESLTCLWPTSTLWMWLKYRDIHLWGKPSSSVSTYTLLDKHRLSSDFIFSLAIVSDPTRMHTWTFQTLDTLALPFPRGPSTWPLPTRINCGLSAAKETWSRAKRVVETCNGTAPGAGKDVNNFLYQNVVITYFSENE